VTATAKEEAVAYAGVFRVAGPNASVRPAAVAAALGSVARGGGGTATLRPLLSTTKLVKVNFAPRLELSGGLRPGWYAIGVRLHATTNPRRVSAFVGPTFRLG
jgi:hypothetical protein